VGRREGRRGGDEESLEILQEGVDKSGDPQKFKSEGMAKATHSPAGAHEQQEVMIPGTCPSRGAGGGGGGGGGGVEVCAGKGGLSIAKGSVSMYADFSECGKPKAPPKVHILKSTYRIVSLYSKCTGPLTFEKKCFGLKCPCLKDH